MPKTTKQETNAGTTQLDFIENLTPKTKRRKRQETKENRRQKNPTPIAGHMSGTMEDLERLQSTEMTITNEVKECIHDSLECYQSCTETRRRCLKLGGKHAEPEHINLLVDCARICSINADFMLRDSTYYPQICALAADICDECADTCERFDDSFMQECAVTCRRCAESCREMAM